MENHVFEKTPFLKLMVAAVLGVGTSIAPLVLLTFGLIQFSIIRIVGPEHVTAAYGVAAGIQGLAIVILGPLGGVIADKTTFKMGRRRFWIIAGSIGGAISMLTITYAPSMPVLILGFCFVQLFYGMVSLSCYSLVPEQVEPERFGRVSGIFGAAGPIFVMVGMMIMGVFADVPIQQKLFVITIIQLVCGIMSALLVKDSHFKGNKSSENKKSFSDGFKNLYPSVKKYPCYTWALLTKLFINITNAGLGLLPLFYIARFHLGQAEIFKINAYTSPSIMLMVVAGIAGGFLSDKIKKQKIFVMVSALITGVCLVTFAFAHIVALVVIGNFAFNFGFGMYGAVDNALVNRILPSKEDIGKDIAIMNATVQLASALVNFVAPMCIALGIILLGGDGYTFFFLILAGFSVLSALAVIPIPEVGKSLNEKSVEKAELVD
ncbi:MULTISPECIES: MFS transporter [Clostridium]|uniref:MFS transporter n=1 Tax=Clostridium frigoriphilum TaxID=443253 RepID=A0ABU7ULD7_9CLOT|nr:MFS transporter [Clostridium sp. DSM 17811]MBU3099490.1 MFS transporter [Clostridium sp. DSM 17811]